MKAQNHTNKIRFRSSQAPMKTSFFYGWMMVVIGAMAIFFSGPGQTFSNSVFVESYMNAFGLDNTAISSLYSAATLASGLLLFMVGRLVDRFGRRVMLTIVAFMLGVACFYNSIVTGPIMLFFGFFMIRYFGQGSMTLVPNTLVSQWFMKYRGRALSFASLGGLLGAASFPPLINWLIDLYGWEATWRILGIILIFFFTPIALFFVRNQPEDIGLLPDGVTEEIDDEGKATSLVKEDSWTLSEAMRTKSFWFVLIVTMVPAAIYTGITFQLFSLLGEQGIDRMTTAFVLSIVPLVSFGCSIVSGFIVERVKVNRMLAVTMLLNVAAPIILIFANSYIIVLVFAVAWGVGQGFLNIPMGVVWPNFFGRTHLGSIQSITAAGGVIGSAIGPLIFGFGYDMFGNYTMVLFICALIFAFGALLAFIANPPQRKLHD